MWGVVWRGVILGLVTGPIFVMMAVLIGETLSFLNIPPEIIVTLNSPSVLVPISVIISVTPLLKYRKSRHFKLTVLLFALTSYVSLGYTLEYAKLGPKGEQIPYLYLLFEFRFETHGEWEKAGFDFYKPKCYWEFYAIKLKNHSLEIASFYYADFKSYPLHSLLKSVYMLFCGMTAEKAYKSYRHLLTDLGFSIDEGINDFTARNETTIVYCRLDERIIMVAKADRDEEWLFNSTVRKDNS